MSTFNVPEKEVQQAIEILRHTQRASTSSIQRRLRIGFTHASAIMDELEARGIVGPPRGSEPRELFLPEPTKNTED